MQCRFCWALLFWLLSSSFNAKAMTGVHPTRHRPAKAIVGRIHLEQAIAMALKTQIGQEFKADIAELAQQGKIRVMTLGSRHYGESGEGCVIRDGRYNYEGLFMTLNEKQTIPELASTLIHEVDHYRQIKRIIQKKSATPVKIGRLEISAFATQLDFIEALEKQGLTDRKTLFAASGKLVFDIMITARTARSKPSAQTYTTAINEMIKFGYSSKELGRTLLTKGLSQCQGAAIADNPQKMLKH